LIHIENVLQKLNTHQRSAVLDESRAALVNANVGSGKTTVLISKALYQHVVRQVSFDDMVVLTFTNKAAGEIKERMIGADPQASDEEMFWFGTFHSVALKMLQAFLPVETLGYTREFTIAAPDELIEMAESLISEHGLRIKYRNKLAKRLEALHSGHSLYGVMKRVDDLELLCDLLEKEKISQNKMDFDDLIHNAVRLLRSESWSPEWVIIDEFQDCDSLQMELIRAMSSENTKLFAVGDPNQTIYSWRGGNRNIFSEFKREYQATEFSLPLNYRSSSTILEAARGFMENSSELEGVREPGSGILVRKHYNPFQEADYLTDKIKRIHEEDGVAYKNIAVFYRMLRQSKTLEDLCRRKEIPFTVSARKTLKDIPVLQWLARLLVASVNKKDRNSLISVLTDTHFGEELTLTQARKTIDSKIESALCEKIRGFSKWTADGKMAAEIYDYFELDNYLSPTSVSFQENKDWVIAFLSELDEELSKTNAEFLIALKDFLNSSALYGLDILAPNESAVSEDTVKLMTLHACKGLEFQYVFIIGVNDGLIPLRVTSKREQNLEEEKRLFFVGITRAKDRLELSYYSSPDDSRILPGKSSYISVIPRHLLDDESETDPVKADLQAFRRIVMENRSHGPKPDIFPLIDTNPPKPALAEHSKTIVRKVVHAKYGEGVIESEDEEIITIAFAHYGLKSFSKDFCSLEFL
jgi:DNA helicase-2/ATP-dependent DNA helicase PcrA